MLIVAGKGEELDQEKLWLALEAFYLGLKPGYIMVLAFTDSQPMAIYHMGTWMKVSEKIPEDFKDQPLEEIVEENNATTS